MSEQHKLVLAVLQEEDYDGTVTALNQHGFFVTKLSSSGGFLRRGIAVVSRLCILGGG